jgi:sulfate transport system ATP-binding protein
MAITVKNVSKRFKDFTALKNINLEIKPGELVALLGPSGSGKTTLLRIIAGLEFADSGEIIMDGEEAHNKAVQERNVGFVFQHYALFKHMTVFDNVAFGLKVRPKNQRPSDAEIEEKVMSLLKLVHLDSFYDRYPNQLSGGQRQRVALARALAVEPRVLLLDEPFGALDAKVRKELRRWMRRLHDEIHITSVFVTHDQEEAMEVADKVVVMSNGKIEQVGTPDQVYHNPSNSFVYDFLGNYNEFRGWRDDEGNIHLDELKHSEEFSKEKKIANNKTKTIGFINSISNKLGIKKLEETVQNKFKTTTRSKPEGAPELKIFCRPHEMKISKKPINAESLKVKIVYINSAGPLTKIEMEDINGKLLFAEVGKNIVDEENFMKGDEVFVYPGRMKIFKIKS